MKPNNSNTSSKEKRRRFMKALGAGTVIAPIAGCTSGQESADTTTEQGNTGTTDTEGGSAETTTGTGAGGGGPYEFNYLGNSQPSATDPAEHVDNPTTIWTLNFYDPLLFVDPEDFQPQPWLATDWTTENSGQTWVFDLRDDVTFHSGNQMTAEDVVYSMERTQAIGRGLSSLYSSVENVEARDETTVAFDLSEPFGPFLGTLVHLFVVDSQVVQEHEQDGDWGNTWLNQPNVAGSGGFTLEAWEEAEQWVGRKFEDYWGPRPDEKPFDIVRYKYSLEASVTQQRMVQGRADLNENLIDPEILRAFRQADNVEVVEKSSLSLFHIPMNCTQPPTDDLHFRKAMTHAFDYETAINDIFTVGTKAAGPVPPTMPGKNENLEPYQFDLDMARQELEQSQYSVEEVNEMGLEYVWIEGITVERRVGLLLQNRLQELGIDLQITKMPWANYTEAVSEKESTPPLQAVYHSAYYNSPDVFTYLMHHPSAMGTYVSASWFTDSELTPLLEEARQTIDSEERQQKYQEAEGIIHQNYPSIYILYEPFIAPMNKNLGGWTYRAVSNYDKRFADLHRIGEGRAK